jgi:hypothetical protein
LAAALAASKKLWSSLDVVVTFAKVPSLWRLTELVAPMLEVTSKLEPASLSKACFGDMQEALEHRQEALQQMAQNVQTAHTSGKKLQDLLSSFQRQAKKEAKVAASITSLEPVLNALDRWLSVTKAVLEFPSGSADGSDRDSASSSAETASSGPVAAAPAPAPRLADTVGAGNLDMTKFGPLYQAIKGLLKDKMSRVKGCPAVSQVASHLEGLASIYETWSSANMTCHQFAAEQAELAKTLIGHQEWVATALASTSGVLATLSGFCHQIKESNELTGQTDGALKINPVILSTMRKDLEAYGLMVTEYQKRAKTVAKFQHSHEANAVKAQAAAAEMESIQSTFAARCQLLSQSLQDLRSVEEALDDVEVVITGHVRVPYERDRPNVLLKLESGDWENASKFEDEIEASMAEACRQLLEVVHLDQRKQELGSAASDVWSDFQELLGLRLRSLPLRQSLLKQKDQVEEISTKVQDEWPTLLRDEFDYLEKARRKAVEAISELVEDFEDSLETEAIKGLVPDVLPGRGPASKDK